MAMGAMRKAALNIRQGNTVSIVVRGRESRPHGEVRQSTAQYNLRKGVRDTMRSPEVILKNLGDKAKDKSYQFKRLYRNLYNPEMYLLAYPLLFANHCYHQTQIELHTVFPLKPC